MRALIVCIWERTCHPSSSLPRTNPLCSLVPDKMISAVSTRWQPTSALGVSTIVAATHVCAKRFSAHTAPAATTPTVAPAKIGPGQGPAPSAVARPIETKGTQNGVRSIDRRLLSSRRLGGPREVIKTQRHHRHGLVDLLTALFPISSSFAPAPMEMNLYVSSTAKAYAVHASMPGMNKSDFNITVDGGILRIQAERNEQRFDDLLEPSSQSAATPPLVPAQLGAQSTATPSAVKGQARRDKDVGADEAEAKRPQAEGVEAGAEDHGMGESAHDDDVTVHYGESFFGRVEQSLELPEDASFTSMTAKYRDGVLEIVVPRQQHEAAVGQRILVQ